MGNPFSFNFVTEGKCRLSRKRRSGGYDDGLLEASSFVTAAELDVVLQRGLFLRRQDRVLWIERERLERREIDRENFGSHK